MMNDDSFQRKSEVLQTFQPRRPLTGKQIFSNLLCCHFLWCCYSPLMTACQHVIKTLKPCLNLYFNLPQILIKILKTLKSQFTQMTTNISTYLQCYTRNFLILPYHGIYPFNIPRWIRALWTMLQINNQDWFMAMFFFIIDQVFNSINQPKTCITISNNCISWKNCKVHSCSGAFDHNIQS